MRRLALLAACLLALASSAAAAELVVVVRADSEVGPLNRDDVINIFLGRYRQLPSGRIAEPFDLPPQSPERPVFYEKLIGKTQAEINAYWARLLFTGRTSPPRIVPSTEKLLDTLVQNPLAIGYLDRARVDRRLRIVFESDR